MTTFKKGDKIQCMEECPAKIGVLGEVYEVLDTAGHFLSPGILLQKTGLSGWVASSRFKLVTAAPEAKFQVGDIVEDHGAKGVVTSTSHYHSSYTDKYPIQVDFGWSKDMVYTPDGRPYDFHKSPSLFLFSRTIIPKKKKVTKTVERWMNIYSDGKTCGTIFRTEKSAKNHKYSDDSVQVRLTGSYEVEE